MNAYTHSSTALAAVREDEARRERDAILDLAELIAQSHPSITTEDAIAQAKQDLIQSGHAIGAAL